MLTDVKARNAVPRDKDYKVADGGGLSLYVTTKGHKSWRLKYRFGGKERRLILGSYPDVSLRTAREMREEAKAALRIGRDPALERRRAAQVRKTGHEDTFEKFAREWHEAQKSRWREVHTNDVITSMERDLFPVIGGYPVNQIDEGLMLAALRPVEKRGAIETAHRLRQRAERIFRFAAGAGSPNSNPAVNVKDALLEVPPKRRWPALVQVEQIKALIRDIDRAGASPVNRLSSRFLALTAQRPGMVRNMRWREIEGVDWSDASSDVSGALWCVPADKMKQELALREDDAFEHTVPLAPQAVEVLRAVRSISGQLALVFPGGRDARQPQSENALGYLYNRQGWKGRHVPHGWRSSFSTIMNGRVERLYHGADRLVIDRLIIDMMLAHRPSGMSETEFRYNRHAYMDRRREIACEWADLILLDADPASTLLDGPRRGKA